MKAYWFFTRWYLATSLLVFVVCFAIESFLPRDIRTPVLWTFVVLAALPVSIVLFWGARVRAKEFTPEPGEELAFSEMRVTGFSNTNRLSSFLMVKQSLIVQVTKDAIYIRPRAAGRGDLYNEFHRIPISDVATAQKLGDRLRLTWSGERDGDFTLTLKDPDAFLHAIHRTSLGTPLTY